MKRVLITGSRSWTDENAVRDGIDRCVRILSEYPEPTIIVHGDARGVDTMAKVYAQQQDYLIEESHPADWEWGPKAGIYRNEEMVNLGADICLAFIKDNSRGASHCARIAAQAGIQTIVIRDDLTDSEESD